MGAVTKKMMQLRSLPKFDAMKRGDAAGGGSKMGGVVLTGTGGSGLSRRPLVKTDTIMGLASRG